MALGSSVNREKREGDGKKNEEEAGEEKEE